MTVITLTPTRRNPDRKAQPVTGVRIGHTDTMWVVRVDGEELNRVLDARHYTLRKETA